MFTLGIDQSATDPMPVCTVTLEDTGSVLSIAEYQEVVVIDNDAIPNPTQNLLQNPVLNPYNQAPWFVVPNGGITLAQNGGGGMTMTYNNTTVAGTTALYQFTTRGTVTAGQAYMLSCTVTGTAPVNIRAFVVLAFYDAAQVAVGNPFNSSKIIPTGSPQLLTAQGTAPATAVYATMTIAVWTTSAGSNSGTITYTQAQIEPMWFSAQGQVYPSSWVASGVANCTQLPDGTTVKQKRLFAGIITHLLFGQFAGQNRQIQVSASSGAWLLDTAITAENLGANFDNVLIAQVVNEFYPGVFTFNHCIQGLNLPNILTQDDTLRATIDSFAALSTYRWYVDPYYDIWYMPVGYYTHTFTLSDTPDTINSFPYSAYSREVDFTQPCNRTHVQVSGGPSTVRVSDGGSYTKYRNHFFDRRINDNSITSNALAYNRGLAEVLGFGNARPIIHLSVDVQAAQPITPGNAITLTNSVDGISGVTYLVQKVHISVIGVDLTGKTRYQYDCDLGSYNADLTNFLAKTANLNTLPNKPPVQLLLVEEDVCVVETIGVTESHTP